MAANIFSNNTWNTVKNIYVYIKNSTLDGWQTVKKGYVFISNQWQLFYTSYNGPTQLTKPTISGTGASLSSVTGTAGTYQSGTYISKTSYIGVTTSSSPQTDGLTTSSLGSESTNPYTITQSDATTPSYIFYYVDAVTGNDSKTYYYYSSSIPSYIGSISDNYNRSVSAGLGTGSGGYIYNLSNLNSTWSTAQISGTNYAANHTRPASGATPANYPLEAIELTGKTDITAQIDIPYDGSGPGILFWAASGTQWWAASSINGTYSTTTYTCSPGSYTYYNCGTSGSTTVSDCLGPAVNYFGTTQSAATSSATTYCHGCSVTPGGLYSSQTTYACGPSQRAYTGSQTVVTTIDSSTVGQPCQFASSNYPTFYYYIVVATTTNTYSSSCNYESYSVSTCSGSSAYSNNTTSGTCNCSAPQTGSNCSGSTIYTDSGGTGCRSCGVTTGTGTAYYTDLVIYSANGSSVSSMATSSSHIATSFSGYSSIDVGRLKVVTSGNSIVVSAYDSSLTNQLGTLSYTASSPTKKSANGSSYAGIIITPSSNDGSIWADNLSIQ